MVADGRRAVEEDQVPLILRQLIQKAGHGSKEGPLGIQVTVLGRGEFYEGRIGTGGDQVDGGPVGRLDEIRDAQILKAEASDRGGDLALGQGGATGRASGGVVLGLGFADQVTGHDAPDGVLFADIIEAHRVGEGSLRVEIDTQDAVSIECGSMGHVERDCRLACAALEVGDGCAEGAPTWAIGLERLTAWFQAAAQRVDLIQSEPPLASIGLDLTRG